MSYSELDAVVEAAGRLASLRRAATTGGEHPSLGSAETAVELASVALVQSETFRRKAEAVADEARRRGLG